MKMEKNKFVKRELDRALEVCQLIENGDSNTSLELLLEEVASCIGSTRGKLE
ncbi:hypothetical protein [Kangiella sp.]|uniref:hypothetical protein n=1 Tax=Kangiella sp. TaxID=1920245 RepID=UPI003A8F0286